MREIKEIMQELNEEVKHIVKVPELKMSMRQQQVELSTSCQHVLHLFSEILEQNNYLLNRLKHSETERFSK